MPIARDSRSWSRLSWCTLQIPVKKFIGKRSYIGTAVGEVRSDCLSYLYLVLLHIKLGFSASSGSFLCRLERPRFPCVLYENLWCATARVRFHQ
jgi:hypothetical protein